MTFMYYGLLVLHVIACFFLIAVVLLQQGKGQDLASAFGGGAGTQTAFGPRGSANILSRATTVLAGVFMVTSLTLSVVRPKGGAFLDEIPVPAPAAASPAPGAASPAAPGASTAAPAESSPAAGTSSGTTAPATASPAPAQ
jgi:preprotein translocase subunit SecG